MGNKFSPVNKFAGEFDKPSLKVPGFAIDFAHHINSEPSTKRKARELARQPVAIAA